MAVTWLHVSDFHLSDKGPYDQEVILQSLLSSVKRFREDGPVRSPDLIFATGDIAGKGNAKEYEVATKFFDALLDAAALNRDRLFIVPGNHDVDRKMGKFLPRTLATREDADEYFDPDTPTPHLTQKFHAFSEWYNDYFKTIRLFPTNTTCSQAEIVTINNCRLAVLPLNSALFCIDNHDHGQLFLGRRCLDAARKLLEGADLKVALIHHPLDWLSPVERANIKAALGESVDLVLQGHYHETEPEGIVAANGGYLKLAAGAAYQKREWPNTAMYATFEGNQVTIFPVRYEDSPNEKWTLDTSVFSSPSYTESFLIPGRPDICACIPSSVTAQENKQQHQRSLERYQAMLKLELGYIRMLGMPGIESVKVNLNDDTFVPLRLSDRKDNAHILFPDEIMKQAFHDGRKRRMLLVIGDPGAGKTTLLKYYALSAFEEHKRLGFSAPVNVFYLPLRDLVRDKEGRYDTLPANLASWSAKHHQTLDASLFDDWLNTGTPLVLLDGLDEISNTRERIEVCRWIDGAWSGFDKAFFIVTSRFTGYNKEEGVELEAEYERADVQDFTQEQQQRFLLNWFTAAFLKEPREQGYDDAGWVAKQKSEAEERTTAIVAHLNASKNKGLRQLAAIPMMLQIMAILWKDRDYMPESRVKLYEAALDYLLEFRDKRRNIKPILSAMRARQVLAPVSLWMQETLKKDEASKADMHTAMEEWLDTLDNPPTAEAFCDALMKRAGLFIESGGKEYLFRHKSFREYLAGCQLKEVHSDEYLNKLVLHFGEDWWEEPLRFFIGSVDANVFDAFMKKLFDSPVSADLTAKQQLLLQTLIEEARGKKVDSLCKKLLDPATTDGRQRVILDCLKAIAKPAALGSLQEFRTKKLARNNDIASRSEEVILDLGGEPIAVESKKSSGGTPGSFRNRHELNAEYILIKGGSYIYSVTEKEERVEDLFVAKYPVTNRLYRRFIAGLNPVQQTPLKGCSYNAFRDELDAIAAKNVWGSAFRDYLQRGGRDLAGLFRSNYDDDRKFGGENQPVVGITWYAAQAYCLWLSLHEPDQPPCRLPTEMEWEWAAGGRQSEPVQRVREYPWPEAKGKPGRRLANYGGNVGATTPVGNYPEGATPEGLYDMAGNVWEWMQNKRNHEGGPFSLRGGSWSNKSAYLSCSARNDYGPGGGDDFGFRVVRPSHSLSS
ncbi:MAG: SUMF1/EgtB/PvdO family nonheme iron enzyme [Chlorobium sp.]|jgi:formylglycine-generating enzyme required for sulfatase activity/UDP-2,3-diacylglucosamine pyrophosphatase LpxH|nr:SUMF1/EgtB/PvdO family nonheme iron enzyme [Chlorobium sp.]